VNEAAAKHLERKLHDITAKLVADRKEHADKVKTQGVVCVCWGGGDGNGLCCVFV
jgi:hypothetical protein